MVGVSVRHLAGAPTPLATTLVPLDTSFLTNWSRILVTNSLTGNSTNGHGNCTLCFFVPLLLRLKGHILRLIKAF